MRRRTFLATALAVGAAPLSAQAPRGHAAGERERAVEELARRLQEGYVDPPTGRRYAARLRERLAAGAYAGSSDPVLLGELLTADLQAVAPDRHLRVSAAATLPARQPRSPAPGAPSGPARGRIWNPSVQDAGWIANGVAYIRYTGFTGQPESVAATEAFMRDHAGARALIVDCRYNGGGGLAEMDVILPHLFAAETRLVRFEMQEAVAKTKGLPFEGPTVRALTPAGGLVRHEHIATPRAGETRWRDAKVFYLTSPRTASAAEHLALAFKHTGRAQLIGTATAGANHFGGFEEFGWGMAVFLPVGRTVDLTTGKDWEAVGVAPDVTVAPERALQEALRRAGVGLPAT